MIPHPSLVPSVRHAVAAVLVATSATACNPVYAPPVRAVHYGAPGRVHQGEVEIGGTMAGVYTPTGGSLHVAYGARDWLSVETGGTFIVAPAGNEPEAMSVMAWAGPRFTLPRRLHGPSLLLDAELGLGAGIGGALCPKAGGCEPDGKRWYNRAAYGGYQGGGLGVGYRWFSFYGRARLEESVATNIPVTFWPSAMLGLGFDAARDVSFDLGGGYLGYANREDHTHGWFYQTGLTIRFGR